MRVSYRTSEHTPILYTPSPLDVSHPDSSETSTSNASDNEGSSPSGEQTLPKVGLASPDPDSANLDLSDEESMSVKTYLEGKASITWKWYRVAFVPWQRTSL